jgi:hypothetical protein
VNACVLDAVGVNAEGFRESLGLDVVTSVDAPPGLPSCARSSREDSPA